MCEMTIGGKSSGRCVDRASAIAVGVRACNATRSSFIVARRCSVRFALLAIHVIEATIDIIIAKGECCCVHASRLPHRGRPTSPPLASNGLISLSCFCNALCLEFDHDFFFVYRTGNMPEMLMLHATYSSLA